MSRDQTIGAAIFIVCAVVALFYVITLFYPQWLGTVGVQTTEASVQFWIIAVPVLVAFVAIMGIGAWIGWTMATTPPPKPIEETPSTEDTKPPENKGQ